MVKNLPRKGVYTLNRRLHVVVPASPALLDLKSTLLRLSIGLLPQSHFFIQAGLHYIIAGSSILQCKHVIMCKINEEEHSCIELSIAIAGSGRRSILGYEVARSSYRLRMPSIGTEPLPTHTAILQAFYGQHSNLMVDVPLNQISRSPMHRLELLRVSLHTQLGSWVDPPQLQNLRIWLFFLTGLKQIPKESDTLAFVFFLQ